MLSVEMHAEEQLWLGVNYRHLCRGLLPKHSQNHPILIL